MQSHHFLLLLVVLVAGYVAGCLYPQLGQKVGL